MTRAPFHLSPNTPAGGICPWPQVLAVALAMLTLPTSLAAQSAACFCVKCLSPSYKNFFLPSASMAPGFPLGECLVGKRIDATASPPAPGTPVFFRHPVNGQDYFKRVVASEGQSVQMIGGVLHIDGTAVTLAPLPDWTRLYEPAPNGAYPVCGNRPSQPGQICTNTRLSETLPNGASYEILDTWTAKFDDTKLFTVPPAHVFVLGDHRDNSVDSRVAVVVGGPGFVPLANIRFVLDE